jgi:hypothetical protein
MDETAYRQALSATSPNACPFEKTILANCATCSRAEKRNIAERELVSCSNAEARLRCIEFRDLLRHNFTFALGKLHIDTPLPHAQEMRMQCGGLKGLRFSLDASDQVGDVAELLGLSLQKFGSLDDLPYSEMVRLANSLYKPR